jgi:hypothetical protein
MFDRIATPRFTKDVDELRTWIMDIRQVLSDNAIKDMLAEEDGKFLRPSTPPRRRRPDRPDLGHRAARGHRGRHHPRHPLGLAQGHAEHPEQPGGARCPREQHHHQGGREVHPQRDGRHPVRGHHEERLVPPEVHGRQLDHHDQEGPGPTNTMYQFADPKFIGKSYVLEDTTMYIRREAYMLEFFAYETMGGTIGHTSGLARIDYE